ncbi:unnamed protein product [Mytilus coruscus]|uniref:C1q domain-containing protein n=1 Tax=Mytilus coruscus TaxID=42192 RepID=A0A6J8D4K8_MYTCO|nr:unnamed protein product [Mytilus coruscus]
MMPLLHVVTSILISVLLSGRHVSGHGCRYVYVCDGGLTSDHTEIIELKKEIEALKEKSKPVAFYAYRSGNLGTGSNLRHRIVVYDRVDLNIGNAYNKHNGKFTAPSDGLYLFHVSTGVYFKSYAVMQLVLNGVVKDIGFPDSATTGQALLRSHSTTATPLLLRRGDVVYARIGVINGGNYIESNQYIRTSFSGTKL